MQSFIGHNATNFGFGILSDLLKDHEWEESGIFPRVTWCDFLVRKVGNSQRYSIQCVLPVNMLNEKIYIFLWFWIIIGIILEICTIFTWLLKMFITKERKRFVKRYLSMLADIGADDKRLASTFVSKFLRHDGVFLLRMIASNAGDLVCAELVQEVWSAWKAGKTNPEEMTAIVQLQPANNNNNSQKMNHHRSEPTAPPPLRMRKKKKTPNTNSTDGNSSAERGKNRVQTDFSTMPQNPSYRNQDGEYVGTLESEKGLLKPDIV